MKFRDLISLISDDLVRYGAQGFWGGVRAYVFIPGFYCTFWYRICEWRKESLLRRILLYPAIIFRRRSHRIWHTVIAGTIGGGLCVGHAEGGGIIINGNVKIGRNCNIHHGVTIGARNRSASGLELGTPEIGDNVYIGPGAKVFGGIKIGNNVAIGANAVVTHDIPDNAVVGGVPAKIISYSGSEGLISRRV